MVVEHQRKKHISDMLQRFQTKKNGLSHDEVLRNQKEYGLNIIHQRNLNLLYIIYRQFVSNPLIMILIVATSLSYFLGQHISSYYIFGMILVSIGLGVWNEYSAEKTVKTLLKKISPTAVVIRDNVKQLIPVSQITIGDVVFLSVGNIIPADLHFIETKNLGVDESVVTGESENVYKRLGGDEIGRMGTTVVSGQGQGVVFAIGKKTEIGKISQMSSYLKPETEFQKGLAKFGTLIIRIILFLTLDIFAINALLGHKLLESILFSLAIAVGLTPELLPIIVTVCLSHGAGKLAKKHVVVKKLISIENLGNMDILCTDKTGTLTEGEIKLVDYFDIHGHKNQLILETALMTCDVLVHHKPIGTGIDLALWDYAKKNNVGVDSKVQKLYEMPFDYEKKLMFSVVHDHDLTMLVVKGAPEVILKLCPDSLHNKFIHERFMALSHEGFRMIAVATKEIAKKETYFWHDVEKLNLSGCLVFLDVPKKTAGEALQRLQSLSVTVKIITGDNEIVTRKICEEVGMKVENLVLGHEMENISSEKLKDIVASTHVFARVTPTQKLRIVQALQKSGHTVGFLGDGVNDLPALHASDAGISVNSAVDVARETASIVLLRKSLNVIADGIIEGRKTFNNTIKYILMSTSSNFGNMFSAAIASFFLPFLPMTPAQILLNNSLYDISQMAIPTDQVDHQSLLKPRHWNINFIKNYMLFFGPISSLYDFLTFAVLLFLFKANAGFFQTGWFIESLATQVLVVFVIRTAKSPFYKSRPGRWLIITCLGIVFLGIILPFTTLAKPLGFVMMPPLYFVVLILLVGSYILLVEFCKKLFLKKFGL